jgi:ADP-ribose pyrophosphatase
MRNKKLEELEKYIDELKTIKKEIRVSCSKQFLNVIPYSFTLNNGIVIPREQLIKGGNDGSAVIIVPIIKDSKEILVTVEPRVFTRVSVSVGFPAGYIEKDEHPIDAGKRELEEETGYSSNNWMILDSFYQDEGVSSAYNHILVAKDVVKTTEPHNDPYEVVRYMSFSYEELLELESMGIINSSNTKLALLKSKQIIK